MSKEDGLYATGHTAYENCIHSSKYSRNCILVNILEVNLN